MWKTLSRRLGQNGIYLVLWLGFALRVAFVLQGADLPIKYDEVAYVSLARQLVSNPLAYYDLVRPPVYPAFLAFSFQLFGDSRLATGIFQSLVSTLLIAVTYTLTRVLFARRGVALLAALLTALYLELVTLARIFLSETLFVFLSALGVLLVLRAWRAGQANSAGRAGGRWWEMAVGGSALALAGLTREVMGYFALLLLPLWLVLADSGHGKRAAANVAALALGLGLVFVPWVARNWTLEGRFVLSNTRGEHDVLRDNWRVQIKADPAERKLGKAGKRAAAFLRQLPPSERTRAIAGKVIQILQTYPVQWVQFKFTQLRPFWRPFAVEARVLRFETLDDTLRGYVRSGLGTSAVALLLLGVVGFFVARDDAPKLLILLYLFYSLAIFVITHYFGRFRLPLLVFIIPYAALALAQGAAWLRAPSLRPLQEHPLRAASAGVVLALFALLSLG